MTEDSGQSSPSKRASAGRASVAGASQTRLALIGAVVVAALVAAWVLWPSDDRQQTTRIGLVGPEVVALDLDKQVEEKNRYWKLYDNRDAPEGAYMGWMLPGADSLPASVPLPQTVQPGKYYVFVKGINYGRPIKVKFSIGGGEATVTTDDDGNTGYWTKPLPITVDSATDELKLTLQRAEQPDEKEEHKQKLLLRGLYLTTDPDEVVLGTDRVVALDYPTEMDSSPPRPGNLVENGSFEVGLGHGWGSTDDRKFRFQSIWDPKGGKDGGAGVKLSIDPSQSGTKPTDGAPVTIVSKPYSAAPNKRHTLSVWMRSDAGKPVTGKIDLVNSFGQPSAPKLEGRRGQHVLSKKFSVGEKWTRVDLSGFLLRYPTADYQVRIAADAASGRHLWVDEISLNEGGPVPYEAKVPLEIGLQRTRPSNLYLDNEPVRMRLRAYNAASRSVKRTVRYEIYDYLNRRVRSGKREVDVPAGSVATGDLDLDVGRRGVFRIVMWVQGENGSEEEVIYGVVPPPRQTGGESVIGAHSNFTDFQYDAMERLGIKWDRAMSPGRFFRWSVVEPSDDKFIWYDEEIRRAARRGVSVLGTLGTNKFWPEWADDDGLPDLDKWEEFVGQVVRHYDGDVPAWEIWNEPNYEFEPAFYAKMLKRAAEAIKRADPNATVVAMGGPYKAEFIQDVFGELRKQYPQWPSEKFIDNLSMHMYPSRTVKEALDGGRAAAFRKQVLPASRLALWNTESGEEDTGFFRTSNAVRDRWGRSLFDIAETAQFAASSPDAVEKVSTTFLETIGNGLRKFFYYDFRVGGATPTWTEGSHTMLEYDDSVRPKGIAYAALARLFDGSKGLGNIKLDEPNSQAFLFDRGGVPLVGLYTADDQPRTIQLTGVQASQVRVFDSMGNRVAVSGAGIEYGPLPVYIEGRGVAVRELDKAFRGAKITQRADKTPPSVSVDEAPRGPVDSSSIHVRWSATDETSIPSRANPEAIAYSYRLRGQADDNEWSDWTQRGAADFADLSAGSYRFEVRAKDAADNQSKVASRTIEVR